MRRRLFWLAIAALYLAPVLAGYFGAGWLAVASFALVFLAFNIVMERMPPALSMMLVSVLVLAVLSLVTVSLGWGLRALLGETTVMQPWPFIALGAGATLLARLAWPPRLTRELEALADEATETLTRMADDLGEAAAETPTHTLDDEAVSRLHAALDALPEDADSGPVAETVLPLTDQADPGALFEAALARAARTPTPRDHAALHWATINDDALDLCLGQRQPARAWDHFASTGDHAALDRFSGAAIRIIHDEDHPHAWRDMPESGEVIRVALAVEEENAALGEELAGLGKALMDLERAADG